MASEKRLQDQVVLITGGASGIGRATAQRCAAEGARLALIDRDEAALKEMAQALDALLLTVDVSDEEAVTDAVARVEQELGSLEAAVNCAGILGPVGPLHTLPTAAIRELFSINLEGMVHSMKAELAVMAERQRGSIVNISSAAGLVGFPTAAPYTASKHAVVGLTRTCAIDYAASGIRINAIAPGGVDTPLLRATTGATPEGRAMIEGMHPMQRLADPEEIAAAVVFLLSADASFVTGEILSVDGGWVAQ